MEMTIRRTSETKARLTFRVVPFEGEMYAPKLFVTVPPAHFCGLMEKLNVKAKKIDTLEVNGDSDVVIFDSILGDEFYLYGKKVAEIDAEYIFTAPKKSGKKYSFVSVTFTSGGKRYDYLNDLPLKPGDQAIVETANGESVVTVMAAFEKTASELALPLKKYKKILRAISDN